MIKIYDFPHGVRGLRVSWLCEEMGLAYTFVPVSYPPDDRYRTLNPFGTVPLLQDGDITMSESIAMLLYIAQTFGPTELLPAAGGARLAATLQFAVFGEASLSSLMNPLLAARFGAPDDQKRNWSAVGTEARLKVTIDRLADVLADRKFLVEPSLTLADISVVTALQLWKHGLNQEIPVRLRPYCAHHLSRPAYKRAIAKHA